MSDEATQPAETSSKPGPVEADPEAEPITAKKPKAAQTKGEDHPGGLEKKAKGESEPDALADTGKRAIAEERRLRKEAENKVRELEQRDIRRSVTEKLGLNSTQAALLVGETEEELTAHYEQIQAAFSPSRGRSPREKLKPGAVAAAEAQDMGKVAERVLS